MSSHLILRPSYSLKPLFFNYLRNELKASDAQLRRRPWNPTRATPEGKPHPMPEPTQYLLNIVKNYYRKTNKVVARSKREATPEAVTEHPQPEAVMEHPQPEATPEAMTEHPQPTA